MPFQRRSGGGVFRRAAGNSLGHEPEQAKSHHVQLDATPVARRVDISGRELHTFGVEVAYPLGGEPDLGAAELTERAAGVASSWTW